MSEFHLVTSARRSPTECAFCGSQDGPFIDSNLDLPVWGRVNICVGDQTRSGCIVQMARLAGCSDPGVAEGLSAELDALEAKIETLEVALEEANATPDYNVVTSVDALIELVGVGSSEAVMEPSKRTRKKA